MEDSFSLEKMRYGARAGMQDSYVEFTPYPVRSALTRSEKLS
jgi:hypothetical protein